ncbi:ATP-binding cassette domain-containing protein [Jatrophihabitans telluris]|uniref:ATP-binding cassette domain-containing protein n=1 Tax=Jatrophihabitans telluris TaxID=2038343 RepID=A0ABY4QVE9_9ACTN|nr:ATP-binding cassette domain-containing protein [Jatrophihabitans telluris]UQX87269.1 ATP-binding cassette domain-containing protein [Jatrophihabitans telluris]
MIELVSAGVRYTPTSEPVFHDLTLSIAEGELCLVVGPTGSGKSSLLGTVNGLVPHFTGGVLSGTVRVAGRDTRTHPPRELADVVGVVGQNPRAGFVTDVVEDELAYTMESLAIPRDVMRRRIEDVLDLLSLAELRDRPLSTLSGGQAQRVAIGSVMTAHPRVLVLDEPTSALDPASAEEVLAVIQRLVHDNGLTVLMAEHRLERVVHYADSVVVMPGGGRPIEYGDPAAMMRLSPVFPAVVELGRDLEWDPLPLTVRDARRRSAGLHRTLATAAVPPDSARPGRVLARVSGATVRYPETVAVDGLDLELRGGEITALMGRNGAGKSSLLNLLTGLRKPTSGTVRLGAGVDPRSLRGRALICAVGLVPQQPADLLYADSVAEECALADREAGGAVGRCAGLLLRIAGPIDPDRHPRDLSEGQRLALALAVVMTSEPDLLLLDEPTRGLDYPAKKRLIVLLRELAGPERSIVLATHDVELAAELSDRTVVMADGQIVADGPSREVVVSSPVFAPQISKVLSPLPYLTVSDVRVGLAGITQAGSS